MGPPDAYAQLGGESRCQIMWNAASMKAIYFNEDGSEMTYNTIDVPDPKAFQESNRHPILYANADREC
jgi:hypothetical protein